MLNFVAIRKGINTTLGTSAARSLDDASRFLDLLSEKRRLFYTDMTWRKWLKKYVIFQIFQYEKAAGVLNILWSSLNEKQFINTSEIINWPSFEFQVKHKVVSMIGRKLIFTKITLKHLTNEQIW